MRLYFLNSVKFTLTVLLTLVCIVILFSCGSNSATGPNNGGADPATIITGRVLHNNGFPVEGNLLTVSCSDSSYIITCDDEGSFIFYLPDAQQEVTITPISGDEIFSFTPSEITLTEQPDDEIIFFRISNNNETIHIVCRITDDNNRPVPTMVHFLSHEDTVSYEAEVNGVFYNARSSKNTITVIPADDGRFIYEPGSYTFSNLSMGDNAICLFKATPATELYSIHCTVRGIQDSSDLIIIAFYRSSSESGSKLWRFYTNNLEFYDLLPGTYRISLTIPDYNVERIDEVTITDRDVYLPDVTVTYAGVTEHTVTGRVVTEDGVGLEGITIDYYEYSQYSFPEKYKTETSETGEYEFTCSSGKKGDVKYILVPQLEGHSFEPDSLTVIITLVPGIKYGEEVQVPDIFATDFTLYQPDSFFPLDNGSAWTYSATDIGEIAITIDGTEPTDGRTYSRFKPSGPGGMTLLRIDGEEVHAWDGDEDIVMLRFGVVPGTEWDSGTDSGAYKRTGVFHGLEDMTVPAGTFTDCLRYESRLNYGKTTYEAYEMWFAEDVGLVRQVRTLVNYGEEIERTEMELVE